MRKKIETETERFLRLMEALEMFDEQEEFLSVYDILVPARRAPRLNEEPNAWT